MDVFRNIAEKTPVKIRKISGRKRPRSKDTLDESEQPKKYECVEEEISTESSDTAEGIYSQNGKHRSTKGKARISNDPEMVKKIEDHYEHHGKNKNATALKFGITAGTVNKILGNPPGIIGRRPRITPKD